MALISAALEIFASNSSPPSLVSFFPWAQQPSRSRVFCVCSNLSQIITNYSVWPRLLLDQPAIVALLIISTAGFVACLKTQKHSSLLPLETAYLDKGPCQDLFQDSKGGSAVAAQERSVRAPSVSCRLVKAYLLPR